jgi:hypothetical protein
VSGSSADITLGYSYNPASQIIQLTKSNNAYAFAGRYNAELGGAPHRLCCVYVGPMDSTR